MYSVATFVPDLLISFWHNCTDGMSMLRFILQISYLIFMCMYNYIVLVKLERDHPSVMEGYVMAYIFLHGLEMIREVGIFLLQLTRSNSTKNKILQVLLRMSASLFFIILKTKSHPVWRLEFSARHLHIFHIRIIHPYFCFAYNTMVL